MGASWKEACKKFKVTTRPGSGHPCKIAEPTSCGQWLAMMAFKGCSQAGCHLCLRLVEVTHHIVETGLFLKPEVGLKWEKPVRKDTSYLTLNPYSAITREFSQVCLFHLVSYQIAVAQVQSQPGLRAQTMSKKLYWGSGPVNTVLVMQAWSHLKR